MNSVTFIICAAGEGIRMQHISPKTPKYLMRIEKKTLLEWSLLSLPFIEGDQIIFVSRISNEHNVFTDRFLSQFSQKRGVSFKSLYIQQSTSGQAETALLAKPLVKHRRIAIFNSDTYFQCKILDWGIHQSEYDGLIPCFKTQGNSWSFFKTIDNRPFYSVIDVAEKNRISDWCSAGFYYFKDGNEYFEIVQNELKNSLPKNNEFFIAPMYKSLLKSHTIKVVDCELFKPMGTPEQVTNFWKIPISNLKKENAK
ncbi:hypothetical protein K2X05_02905 [bacterium]|nr:hypothetical protein [bacterium]